MLSALSCDYDVILLNETWLNSSHNNEEYFAGSYIVYRRDRYQTPDTQGLGGGALIAVNKRLHRGCMFHLY